MPYLRRNGKLIFSSSGEILTYYAALIDELTPQLQGITLDDYQVIHMEIAELRKELVSHLKNFGYSQVDGYFNEAMASAESEQEHYALSNAYELILLAELTRIKDKLYVLRTT